MSRVTNLILATSMAENSDEIIQSLKEFRYSGTPFIIENAASDSLPKDWYGGSKRLECLLFIGAYNYLDLQALIQFMRERINWYLPGMVQIIVKEQDDPRFRIINVFPEEV